MDFENRQVTIGADGTAKNARHRSVNFSGELEALLTEMHSGRQPDSELFIPRARTRGTLDAPPVACANPLHWCAARRGCPASASTTSGTSSLAKRDADIDFMTIASWLGHSDGGILVGKIYGHLADGHKARMANNLTLLKPAA